LGLNSDELAFYDALANNEESVHELGDETLKKIAHELAESLRNSTRMNWSVRESERASLLLKNRTLSIIDLSLVFSSLSTVNNQITKTTKTIKLFGRI